MRTISLFLILAALPLLCGCGAIDAQAASDPGRVLWNETDAAAQIASLQAASDTRFDAVDTRLATIDTRLDAIQTTVSALASPPEVVQAPTTFPAAGAALPLCITIGGVDYDLDELLEDYDNPLVDYTGPWEDGTPAAVRRHLAVAHAVTGIDTVPDELLAQLHVAVSEKERLDQKKTVAVQAPAEPPPTPTLSVSEKSEDQTRSKTKSKTVQVTNLPPVLPAVSAGPCPNGQCPQATSSATTSTQSTVRWFSTSSSSRKAQRLARKGR